MTARIRVHAIVRGDVQGVGFRYRAREEAVRLGLAGFVMNRSDGTVEVEAEGAEAAVRRFVSWLHTGPEFARVLAVDSDDIPVTGASGFDLRH